MAISPVTTSVAREVFHTALAAVATKGVGSGYRVWDDRNAPWQVKKNTIQRESATLGMVSALTAALDWLGHQFNLKHIPFQGLKTLLQKAASHHILLKSIPITLGIFAAEAISRKVAPRNIWKPGGELNESVIEGDEDHFEDDGDEDAINAKVAEKKNERRRSFYQTSAVNVRPVGPRVGQQPFSFYQPGFATVYPAVCTPIYSSGFVQPLGAQPVSIHSPGASFYNFHGLAAPVSVIMPSA